MKHQVQLARDGEELVTERQLNFRRAFSWVDTITLDVNSGVHGIGKFEISVYEENSDGCIEKCIFTSGTIAVPAGQLETAT